VRLAKLKKDADLNGKVGMVVQAMEWVGGKRLAVELDDKSCNHGHHSGKPYMVKPCHLEVTSADHLRAASAAPAITPIVREEHRLDLTSDEDEEFEEAPPQEPLKQQQPRRDAAEETAPVAARFGVAGCSRLVYTRDAAELVLRSSDPPPPLPSPSLISLALSAQVGRSGGLRALASAARRLPWRPRRGDSATSVGAPPRPPRGAARLGPTAAGRRRRNALPAGAARGKLRGNRARFSAPVQVHS
jgi:hypothetical protein